MANDIMTICMFYTLLTRVEPSEAVLSKVTYDYQILKWGYYLLLWATKYKISNFLYIMNASSLQRRGLENNALWCKTDLVGQVQNASSSVGAI